MFRAFRARKGWFSPAGSLLPGLVVAQAVATVQVLKSNRDHLRSLESLRDSGYLVVPTEGVMAILGTLGPALSGGLFFTLTLGAALALTGLVCAWTWDRLFRRTRRALLLFAALWAAALAAVNSQGFTLFGSLFFALVPATVFIAAAGSFAPRGESFPRRELMPLVPLVILAAVWVPLLDEDAFSRVRDNLLGRNAAGIALAERYYRNTPYASHVLQPLDQRLIKTCVIEGFEEGPLKTSLERALISRDYLPLRNNAGPVDIRFSRDGADLALLDGSGRPMLTVSIGEFLARPDPHLRAYAGETDRWRTLRAILFVSLALGSPLLLYLGLYALFRSVLRWFPWPAADGPATVLSVLLCLIVALTLIYLAVAPPGLPPKDRLHEYLQSPRSSDRVAALRLLNRDRLDIAAMTNYEGYGKTLQNLPPLERFWLVRVLGHSRGKAVRADLLLLADDPYTVVSYRAYGSLGRHGRAAVIPELQRSLKDNPHWYSQWSAYRALRRLGWEQASP